MLEDHTMDKKNRSSQSLNKGNPSENKKSQDASISKQIPKQSRRRESAGAALKNEASGRTKPMPQKFKSLDKRPKSRSSYGGGKEGSKVNFYEDEPELGSIYIPGSRKQNLNHLLNFQYTSPAGQYSSNRGRSSYAGRSVDYSMGYNNYLMQSLATVHKHKYNKEQFLQANCQFVVKVGEDYNVHLADPDILVKWEFIQQIRGFGNEDIKCPICLDLPRAPQMTRCGHCFCWPCILHYLALSDKSWRKCPICYEAVHCGDLKSFQAVVKTPHAVNQEVTFQLMKRERGSTVVTSVAQWDFHSSDTLMNVSETQLDTTYAKLLSASVNDILDIINTEEAELYLLLEELKREQCPTLCFTERALELVYKRKSCVMAEIEPSATGAVSESAVDVGDTTPGNTPSVDFASLDKRHEDSLCKTGFEVKAEESVADGMNVKALAVQQPERVVGEMNEALQDVVDNASLQDMEARDYAGFERNEVGIGLQDQESSYGSSTSRVRYESVSSEEPGGHGPTSIQAEDLDIGPPSHLSSQPSRYFYFYQAQDGQQLFLHAVNVRMLEMSYGTLASCPPLISGRILEKETGSMTPELRTRLRYLQHLPVTCQFEVAEIELKPPLITQETVDRFKDQLASRERRRAKRARDDKRRAARIDETLGAQMWGGRGGVSVKSRRGLHIESRLQFPECGVPGVGNAALSYSTESSRASSPRRPESPLTAAVLALSLEEHQQQNSATSFAQRLRAGSSMNAGDNAVFWPSVGERERRRTVSSEEAECSSSAPHRVSLSEIMGVRSSTNEASPSQSSGTQSSNKKKKRKQQTLLFATGGMVVNK